MMTLLTGFVQRKLIKKKNPLSLNTKKKEKKEIFVASVLKMARIKMEFVKIVNVPIAILMGC